MAGEAGGGGGAKPILQIPVDDSAWLEFLKSFGEYQDALGKQSQAWASTNSGIKQMGTAFDHAEESFDGLIEKASSPKFSGPTNGVFARIDKTSKETAKSWTNISKEIEKSGKNMAGLLREGGKFSALGGFLGLGGAAIGASALFGAVRGADNSLADQNILNRKLGLKPGEEGAFTNVYEKAGGDDALLHKVANAQAHQDQWRGFMALGLSQSQITGMDPADLAAEVLKRGGEQFNARGAGVGMWADATGVSSLLGTENMRAAGSRVNEFGSMHGQYLAAIPNYAQKQQDLDSATAAKQQLDAALAKDAAELDKALIKLNPLVIESAEAVTKWVTAFADSKDLDRGIKDVETGFEALSNGLGKLDDLLNWLVAKEKPAASEQQQLGNAAMDVYNDLKAGNTAKAWADLNRPITDAPATTGDVSSSSTKSGFNEDKILDAIRMNESSGKAGAVNAASGAAGLYGLVPANAKGINVDDPVASRAAARKVLDDQLAAFNGDLPKALAGYDGDTHVAADSKKYGGDWLQGARQETIDYLKKTESQYGDIGLTPDQQKFVDAHTTVKAASAAAQKQAFEKHAKDPIINPQILPFTDDDARAKADYDKSDTQVVSESLMDRLTRGLGMIGTAISAGGGAFARGNDTTSKRIDRQGNAPYNVNIVVTTPAGSSTTTTLGTLAQ